MGDMDAPDEPVENTYGQEVYDALKRHHSGHLVLSRLTYSTKKRLREAERGDLSKVFRHADYRSRQLFKRASPAQLADFLVLQAIQAQIASVAILGILS